MRKKFFTYALAMSMAVTNFGATAAYAQEATDTTNKENVSSESGNESSGSETTTTGSETTTSGSENTTSESDGKTSGSESSGNTSSEGSENTEQSENSGEEAKGTSSTEKTGVKKIDSIKVEIDPLICGKSPITINDISADDGQGFKVDDTMGFGVYEESGTEASSIKGGKTYIVEFVLTANDGYEFADGIDVYFKSAGQMLTARGADNEAMSFEAEFNAKHYLCTAYIKAEHDAVEKSNGKVVCDSCGTVIKNGSGNSSSGSSSTGKTGGYSGESTNFYSYSGPNGSTKGSIPNKDGSSTSAPASQPQNTVKDGWQQSGADWYYVQNGANIKSNWALLGYNGTQHWYYFDANGKMATGWVTDNGSRYYLNPVSDGTKGRMMTGWQKIDGKDYYFETVAGQNQGHLYMNANTPDGHTVGADGVLVK